MRKNARKSFMLWSPWFLVAVAILVAWINYIIWLHVRWSVQRSGVRRVVGLPPTVDLSIPFEALVMNLIAFILAVGLIELVLPHFNQLQDVQLRFLSGSWITGDFAGSRFYSRNIYFRVLSGIGFVESQTYNLVEKGSFCIADQATEPVRYWWLSSIQLPWFLLFVLHWLFCTSWVMRNQSGVKTTPSDIR